MAAAKKTMKKPVMRELEKTSGKAADIKLEAVLAELKQMGTAQNVKVYRRHGVSGPVFGVSFANLGKLQKQIRTNGPLAQQLWKTGNFDAMNLATLIADTDAVTSGELEEMVKDLDSHAITDTFVKVAARSKHAHKKAEAWRKNSGEWISRAGWMVVSSIASRADDSDTSWLKSLIPLIEQNIHSSKNRIKDAMNYALIAIGGSHAKLTQEALAAADRIGHVEVDHGETGCKTRPARPYIKAILARGKMRARPQKKSTTKVKRSISKNPAGRAA